MADTDNIQKFLNSVRDTGETMHSLRDLKELQAESTRIQVTTLNLTQGLQQLQAASMTDQAAFASDLRTHVDVQKATAVLQRDTTAILQQLADGVRDLTAATKELTKAAKNGGGDP